MTEKRYFERKWEGEYYIFDSQTISEKEFDEKVQYEDYQAFADSMTGEEVTDRLNKYNKAYLDCHNDVLRLEKENEQLKSDNKNCAKKYRELFNKYIELHKENKEIKEKNKFILKQIKAFRDDCVTYLDFDGVSTLNRLLDILGGGACAKRKINVWRIKK